MGPMYKKKYVIVSVSSDFGMALAEDWLQKGQRVVGTYRTDSNMLKDLRVRGLVTHFVDMVDPRPSEEFLEDSSGWDVLVLAAGDTAPVGKFADLDFSTWTRSVQINLLSQLQMTHSLLPRRSRQNIPTVIFFAGGGTNNAVPNYSAYTLSKIGLIKMAEQLDAEIPDVKFTILGPGWVKTKIHEATLNAGPKMAGLNYEKTKQMLSSDDCNPIERVIDCCNWVIEQPRQVVGGRNFSVVHDAWGSEALRLKLESDQSLYKLRRLGNDWKP